MQGDELDQELLIKRNPDGALDLHEVNILNHEDDTHARPRYTGIIPRTPGQYQSIPVETVMSGDILDNVPEKKIVRLLQHRLSLSWLVSYMQSSNALVAGFVVALSLIVHPDECGFWHGVLVTHPSLSGTAHTAKRITTRVGRQRMTCSTLCQLCMASFLYACSILV